MKYSALLAPGNIGTMTLRNRLIVTAMGVSLAEPDGVWGERIRSYHEEQARGGAGLIITGATGVAWPRGGVQVNQLALSEDRYIPGLQAVAEIVHRHGAKLAVQLHFAGSQSSVDMLAGRPVMVPSVPLPEQPPPWPFLAEEIATSVFPRITSIDWRPLTIDEIQGLIRDFSAAALRAKTAGADGVEIHGGHGYILSGFLSPAANRRTDDYGGSLENRARILVEVITAIRTRVGDDFPVWVKLDGREVGKPGGITIEDAVLTAKLAERAGADAITATAYHAMSRNSYHSESNIPHVPCTNLPLAARIKAAVSIPVIASGRIEPEQADAAIRSGKADFIAMGRKMLADPHLPRKLSEGKEADIRPCIYCYTCVSAIYASVPSRCAVNPEMGFEYRAAPMASSGQRHVAIIGGGPAGMEAARRLDGLGYQVTLLERADRLGGTLRLASLAYEANEPLLDWLVRQVERSGVDVRLGTEASPELLRELQPDSVVVATGARRTMPDIPGNDLPHVFSGDDLRQLLFGESSEALRQKTSVMTRLATRIGATTGATANIGLVRSASRQWMPLGRDIVIIGGELVGLELAEFLQARGRRVAVVDDIAQFGAGLPLVRRMRVLEELEDHGVPLHPSASDIRITADATTFTAPGGEEISAPAENVIVAKGACGDDSLAETLRASGFAVAVCGDCTGIGYIEGAMRSAANAVRSLTERA